MCLGRAFSPVYLQLAEESSSGDLPFPNKCRGVAAGTRPFHQRNSNPPPPPLLPVLDSCRPHPFWNELPSQGHIGAWHSNANGIFTEGTRWLIVTVGLGFIFFFFPLCIDEIPMSASLSLLLCRAEVVLGNIIKKKGWR